MPSRPKRMDIGFGGGQSLVVRTSQEQYESLVRALESEGRSRWHKLNAEDSEVLIDLPQVVYVQYEGDEHKVGF